MALMGDSRALGKQTGIELKSNAGGQSLKEKVFCVSMHKCQMCYCILVLSMGF